MAYLLWLISGIISDGVLGKGPEKRNNMFTKVLERFIQRFYKL